MNDLQWSDISLLSTNRSFSICLFSMKQTFWWVDISCCSSHNNIDDDGDGDDDDETFMATIASTMLWTNSKPNVKKHWYF